MVEKGGERQRSNSSSSSRFSLGSTGRLSFNGSMRLNDLLNEDDDRMRTLFYHLDSQAIGRAMERASYTHVVGENIEAASVEITVGADDDSIHKLRDASLDPNMDISDSDSAMVERESLGSTHSNESGSLPKEQSKIGQLFDKAKRSGKRLVEKKKEPTPELIDEASQCQLLDTAQDVAREPTPALEEPPTIVAATPTVGSLARHCRTLPFFQQRMFLLGLLIAFTFVFSGFFTGIMWGVYLSLISFLYLFVSDPHPKRKIDPVVEEFTDAEIAEEAHEAVDTAGLGEAVVYKGWMNELRSRYHPASYHVNNTQSVLVRLENNTLRVSRPAKSVLKHAFHMDPTLTSPTPTITAQTIYDLTDAKVSLRPKRLAARRWWSRKYPVAIRFAHKGSALAEVDMTRSGMSSQHSSQSIVDEYAAYQRGKSRKRAQSETVSVSLHHSAAANATKGDLPMPPSSQSEVLPPTHIEELNYDAESDSTTDDEGSPNPIMRSNSAGDLTDYSTRSKGCNAKNKGRTIYLFFRAAREKERWFHLLREACSKSRTKNPPKPNSSFRLARLGSVPGGLDKLDEDAPNGLEHEFMLYKINHIQFAKQLLGVMGCTPMCSPDPGSTVTVDLGSIKWKPSTPESNSELVSSVHALASRIFFDFCRDKYWTKCIKEKIQAKISTVHLPYFIEKLELSELDLGTNTPSIVGVYSPKMDEWGLWVDFELRYKGCIRLVLQTSVNLMKLQSGQHQAEAQRKVSRWTDSVRVSHHSDPDLPESPESSPDEDFGSKNVESSAKAKTGKKILSIVERAAQSSILQKVAKIHKVAKLIEEVSSTPLILNVTVEVVEGTMTVNLPPPPSDRIWYAFRKPPTLNIKAVPQVGDRSVDMSTVSDWIESKLRLLIEKNLVCPNMDDIILPVMSGNALLHMGYNK
ncbi:unnamed protein product, partial [Mesorhabditis spiculigera]